MTPEFQFDFEWEPPTAAANLRKHGLSFEPAATVLQGVILSDHARSLDWRERKAELICRIPDEVVDDVTAKIIALLSGEG